MNGVFLIIIFDFAVFKTFADKAEVQKKALLVIKRNFSAAAKNFKDHGLYAVFVHN